MESFRTLSASLFAVVVLALAICMSLAATEMAAAATPGIFVSNTRYTPGKEYGTWLYPCKSIQDGVFRVGMGGAIILIEDGTYVENVAVSYYSGIELRGNGPSVCVLQGNFGASAQTECETTYVYDDPEWFGQSHSVRTCTGTPIDVAVTGLAITGNAGGSGTNIRFTNCVVGGELNISGYSCEVWGIPEFGAFEYETVPGTGVVINCTVANGMDCGAADVTVRNSVILGAAKVHNQAAWSYGPATLDVAYTCWSGPTPICITKSGHTTCPDVVLGEGNIEVDPLLADPLNGDYHLKSRFGRRNPATQTWVTDDVTSPCIDAGDPASDYSSEPQPNGSRINMGAYGNTTEASRSTTYLIGDVNGDCAVNVLDLIQARNRLGQAVSSGDNWKADVNGDGLINVLDLLVIRGKLNTQCE